MPCRQYQYQGFLLQCPYKSIKLEKYLKKLPEDTQLFSYGRNLFDALDYRRKIPLTFLDTNIDTHEDLKSIANSLQGVQALYIVDDRVDCECVFVKRHSEATKQAFIWQLENMGIHCYWSK